MARNMLTSIYLIKLIPAGLPEISGYVTISILSVKKFLFSDNM